MVALKYALFYVIYSWDIDAFVCMFEKRHARIQLAAVIC